MASRRNQHCANYIGTLSFPIGFRCRPSNTIALACECEKRSTKVSVSRVS